MIFHASEEDEPAGAPWGKEYFFLAFALSEWVARVPGLFWKEGSDELRKLANLAVQYESEGWRVLHPRGKSDKIVGGIGTLKIPPSEGGRRLVTPSAGHNASSGIPALVSPEVWEHHRLGEGCVIDFFARWQPMAADWASRFPSIRGIPRGYLVLDEPEQVEYVLGRASATQIHPYTVMEYSRGNALFFDFVYATADTAEKSHRKALERFFDFYKNDAGRNGRYLLSADIGEPLWEADFDSPSALRAHAGASAQLDLLEARVRGESFKGKSLNAVLELLAQHYDDASLRRLSNYIGVAPAHWLTPGTNVATLAAQLLNRAVSQGEVEELLDAVALDYPGLFLAGAE